MIRPREGGWAALGHLADGDMLLTIDGEPMPDVEAVHQMRVTSRSLRSVLKAAAPLFDAEVAEELDARLRDLARALSAARDAEVTAELLAGRVAELDGRVGPAAAESAPAPRKHRATGFEDRGTHRGPTAPAWMVRGSGLSSARDDAVRWTRRHDDDAHRPRRVATRPRQGMLDARQA